MKIYLDDDSARRLLLKLLINEGHDVVLPAHVGYVGRKDPEHFMFAIGSGRILLTHNHDDFELLHKLVMFVGGHHPGIWTVRRDNNPKKDMKAHHIVRAVRKVPAAGIPIADELHVLNHWR